MNETVSVIISCFNSSPYILETLNSILNQTWSRIELIVTDDCSSDDTVDLFQQWISSHKSRFVNTILVQSKVNTGVAANANRGLYLAKGEWIKFLGADDTLEDNCIFDNMTWVHANSHGKVLFSRVSNYQDTFTPQNLISTTQYNASDSSSVLFPGRSAESQYRMLLVCDRIHFSPSAFLHRETLIALGGFDERFRWQEDYPLWLKLTKNGYKLFFMDKITVNYRQHSGALNNTGVKHLIKANYFKTEEFRKVFTYPFLPFDVRNNQRFKWVVSQPFRKPGINRDTKLNRLLLQVLTVYLNPFRYIIWIRKQLIKDLKCNEFYI